MDRSLMRTLLSQMVICVMTSLTGDFNNAAEMLGKLKSSKDGVDSLWDKVKLSAYESGNMKIAENFVMLEDPLDHDRLPVWVKNHKEGRLQRQMMKDVVIDGVSYTLPDRHYLEIIYNAFLCFYNFLADEIGAWQTYPSILNLLDEFLEFMKKCMEFPDAD